MSEPRLIAARKAFDRALASPPKVDGHAMTEATEAVCAYRDDLRRRLREAPDDTGARGRLRSTNLIVSLLLAGHYPLGETPWEALHAVPGLLDSLAEREPA